MRAHVESFHLKQRFPCPVDECTTDQRTTKASVHVLGKKEKQVLSCSHDCSLLDSYPEDALEAKAMGVSTQRRLTCCHACRSSHARVFRRREGGGALLRTALLVCCPVLSASTPAPPDVDSCPTQGIRGNCHQTKRSLSRRDKSIGGDGKRSEGSE